jgi:hypothetical protein
MKCLLWWAVYLMRREGRCIWSMVTIDVETNVTCL